MYHLRRKFIRNATLAAAAGLVLPQSLLATHTGTAKKIRVLVWDERQPVGEKTYGDFLGNQVAKELGKDGRFSVTSVALDDAQQGISTQALDNTDVLIWWGHIRHGEIAVAKGQEIAQRIAAGKLSFIGLHSAHWSTPFVEAMAEVTKQRTLAQPGVTKNNVEFVIPEIRKRLPEMTERVQPYTDYLKFPDGRQQLTVYLPNCCFPHVADEGKPSVLKPKLATHAILKGLPVKLTLAQTEMYGEPFHVPEPDELLLEEYWADGKWFRSGMVWRLGKGRIFYFRPGHEGYPIFKEPWVIQMLKNAVAWLGTPH